MSDGRRYAVAAAVPVALVALGTVLQSLAGPVRWSALAWPVGFIVLSAYVALMFLACGFLSGIKVVKFLCSIPAAVTSVALSVALTIVMGLVPQIPVGVNMPGTVWQDMLCFWPLVLLYALVATVSGMAGIRRLLHLKFKDIPFCLNHLGLFTVLVWGTVGHADVTTLRVPAVQGIPVLSGTDGNGRNVETGLSIRLDEFRMENYDDGTPKYYASDLFIILPDGSEMEGTLEVNKPMRAGDWRIYQYSYGTDYESGCQVSILLLERDPWHNVVYAGLLMMALGALWHFFDKRRIWVLPILAAAMWAVGHFFWTDRNLVPALQSRWFSPHIATYIVTYTCIGLAFLADLIMLFVRRKDKLMKLCDWFTGVGFALMTIGMLMGAVWAGEAWGHFWTWDPKETWSLITWLSLALYIHIRKAHPAKTGLACFVLIFSFLCLQMCWWGINLLPSVQAGGLHTYNA